MTTRSIRASRSHARSVEQQQLLDKLLDVFDDHTDMAPLDALEVLTIMTATLVTTHAHNRHCAEGVMHSVVLRMNDIIAREPWIEERPETVKH